MRHKLQVPPQCILALAWRDGFLERTRILSEFVSAGRYDKVSKHVKNLFEIMRIVCIVSHHNANEAYELYQFHAFIQNAGPVPLPYVDIRNAISLSFKGYITSEVNRLINGTEPNSYGVDYVFSNPSSCQSKHYTSYSVLNEGFCSPFSKSLSQGMASKARNEISCSEGQLETQVILAEADSQPARRNF